MRLLKAGTWNLVNISILDALSKIFCELAMTEQFCHSPTIQSENLVVMQ